MAVPEYAKPGEIVTAAICLDCSWHIVPRHAWSDEMEDPDVTEVRKEAIGHGKAEGHRVNIEIRRRQVWKYRPEKEEK